ncbi:hypothetical protein P7L54_06085 [Acinetobacter bereziniae]|uniref:Uncharacterized protein n=1 Tax=Acinetobacter bereziniae LMG 1003 = CIP 70.12 TaxID=981324 RepID=N9DQH5_ACIBZ|nr:hypothetical protein [Acinetobacter bereziniae]ENW00127.1 hypothetical protein F938_00770 [Acinetobacter bereziniae LMG 1003 = CIP 70.12]MBJ9908614.1 hypothetical protein [Acinetobacter bereziniae]MBJ9929923.1 hypothetical protein [Acinetobacter bereziniae]MDG3555518.1 hypothetical protein [Acinetobacter bereziniae]MDP6003466.1 hypothetical protein [Acinetobacter bereziniae]
MNLNDQKLFRKYFSKIYSYLKENCLVLNYLNDCDQNIDFIRKLSIIYANETIKILSTDPSIGDQLSQIYSNFYRVLELSIYKRIEILGCEIRPTDEEDIKIFIDNFITTVRNYNYIKLNKPPI